MELTLLGTGCPKVDHNRFGPANLVSTPKSLILIDCGSGVTQRLKEAKVSAANINALFLTHLHSDHTLEEVGQQFSVTRERIRQIEAKALRKLKHPTRARKLKTFLDE